jgi:hypothetical protein
MKKDFELKSFGDLKPGNVILDHEGNQVIIKSVYDEHIPERMYEIELSDGTKINASGNHLWYIIPDTDKITHSERLKKAKKFLTQSSHWEEEALMIAEEDKIPYEISLEDLMNFFDFIEDHHERYYLLLRTAISIGHIVEESVAYKDYFTGEKTNPAMEKIYDARRMFQQLLSLTGKRKYTKRWPVIVGRVETTDTIFHRYPDVEIPVSGSNLG